LSHFSSHLYEKYGTSQINAEFHQKTAHQSQSCIIIPFNGTTAFVTKLKMVKQRSNEKLIDFFDGKFTLCEKIDINQWK